MPAASRLSDWQLSSPQQAPRPATDPETQVHYIVVHATESNNAVRNEEALIAL